MSRTAAIYLRRSAPDERDALGGTNRSIVAQERECRELAVRYGLEVVAVFDEGAGKSASHLTNDERPEYQRAMAEMGSTYDVLLAWALDRLTRKGMSAVGGLLDLAEDRGGRILTADGFDTDAEASRLMASFMSEMARSEMTQMSKRIRRGKDEQRRRGEYLGGAIPYGLVGIPNATGPSTIVVDPEAKVVINVMVDRLINGATLGETCRWLNEHGHTTAHGAPWRPSTLARFVRRPHLVGYRQYGDGLFSDDSGDPVRVTEPILRDSIFARVDKVLASRNTRGCNRGGTNRGSGSRPTSLLGGLVTCGECGDWMHHCNDRKKSAATGEIVERRYYRCPVCSPAHSIRAEPLESHVARLALLFISTLEPDSAITAEVGRRVLARFTPDQVTRRQGVEDDIAGLETRLRKFRKENLSGALDDDEYDSLIHEGAMRRDTMLAELATLPEAVPDLGILFDLAAANDDPDSDIVGEGSAWAALEHYRRREVLKVLVNSVTIARRRLARDDIEGRSLVDFASESNVVELGKRVTRIRHFSTSPKRASA